MAAPRTIEELKRWAVDNNLPLDQMRTHIGDDVRSPRCFGIYQDARTGDFITYKNKSDGSRSIRYQGPDEARAVRELYDKMRERVAVQKSARASGPPGTVTRRRRRPLLTIVLGMAAGMLVFPMVLSFLALGFRFSDGYKRSQLPYAQTGYYYIDDQVYYHRGGGDWYSYDGYTWSGYLPDAAWALFDDYLDYYAGYDEDYGFEGWYEDYSAAQQSAWDDDDDDDYSWNDSWDWDDSYDDWDSDW